MGQASKDNANGKTGTSRSDETASLNAEQNELLGSGIGKQEALVAEVENMLLGRGRGRGRGRRGINDSSGSQKRQEAVTPMAPGLSVNLPGSISSNVRAGHGRGTGIEKSASSKPIYPHKLVNVKKSVPLDEYSAKDLFFIRHAESDGMDRVYLIPQKDLDVKKLEIADEIQMHILSVTQGGGYCDQYTPTVGDVVLARNNENSAYFRALLLEFFPETLYGSKSRVVGLDSGLEYVVDLLYIQSANAVLMDIPKLTHSVILDKVPEYSNSVIKSDYEALMKSMRKVKLRLQIERVDPNTGLFVVDLLRRDTKHSVHQDIKDLETWEWRKILDLGVYRTDAEILSRGSYSNCSTEMGSQVLPSLDLSFQATLLADGKVTVNAKSVVLYLKPITTYVKNLEAVLETQLEHYIRLVTKTSFYPAIGEQALVFLPNAGSGGGKWRRMIRLDVASVFYDVDNHTFTQIESTKEGVDYRRLPPEFNRIPKLVLEAEVPGLLILNEKSKKEVEQILVKGRQLTCAYERDFRSEKREEELTPICIKEISKFLERFLFNVPVADRGYDN